MATYIVLREPDRCCSFLQNGCVATFHKRDRISVHPIFRIGVFADGGTLASNWGHCDRRRSGRLAFQRPCSIPFEPIPRLAVTDLLIAGAAEPPAFGVHPG